LQTELDPRTMIGFRIAREVIAQ
jgi:GMC oxidoreductase